MLAIALSLGSATCFGVADFRAGIEGRRISSLVVGVVSQGIALALTLPVVLATGEMSVSGAAFVPGVIAGAAEAVVVLALYRALAIGTMSVVAPITATGAVVPVMVGLLDGERPGPLQYAGIVVAMVGVVLVTREGPLDEARRRTSRRSIALALVAAAAIGVGLTALDRAGEAGVLEAVGWSRLASVLVLVVVAALSGARLAAARPRLWPIALIGIADVAAVSLYVVSTTEGLLSLVAVISALYPVATVVLARVVLSEQIRRIQAFGVAAALLGVALVAGG